jgi:uncharacterized membrane protein YraQ (UPF0718 family)
MGQIKFIGAMLMTGLFAFAIISFVTQFGVDNNSAVQLANDPQYSSISAQIQSNVSTFDDDAETSSTSFFKSQAESGDEVSSSGEQFKTGVGTATSTATSTVRVAYEKIFGQDGNFSVFVTALVGFILYMGAMYAYKTWFGRNPD